MPPIRKEINRGAKAITLGWVGLGVGQTPRMHKSLLPNITEIKGEGSFLFFFFVVVFSISRKLTRKSQIKVFKQTHLELK